MINNDSFLHDKSKNVNIKDNNKSRIIISGSVDGQRGSMLGIIIINERKWSGYNLKKWLYNDEQVATRSIKKHLDFLQNF